MENYEESIILVTILKDKETLTPRITHKITIKMPGVHNLYANSLHRCFEIGIDKLSAYILTD